MEKETVISVKNIGKKYNITHQQGGYITMRDVLTNIIKSPFKFIKQKTKEIAGVAKKEEFWALRGVDFEVKKGEVIGIIGRNGAGKSTLLKILSQITPPTEGEIKIKGRVGSLLEVGTGFHPELSGRDNIFLNGAILGMTRKEIAKKFDEIVKFAGIEQFLDTPVKRYSSGMYVRLAFSVAAHMEPDILIIDEVLAVGDAEFQKKCLGKMDEITKKEGRTIIFVSHNMVAVKQLCKKTVLLEKGHVKLIGETDEVIRNYTNDITKDVGVVWNGSNGDENIKISNVSIKSLGIGGDFYTSAPIEIIISGEIFKPIKELILGFYLFSEYGYELAYSLYDDHESTIGPIVMPGKFAKKFTIPANTLAQGGYWLELEVGIHNIKTILKEDRCKTAFRLKKIDGVGQRFPIPERQGLTSLFRPLWSDTHNTDN